jgi:hypothetical protein
MLHVRITENHEGVGTYQYGTMLDTLFLSFDPTER